MPTETQNPVPTQQRQGTTQEPATQQPAPQPQTPEQAVTDLFGGLLGVKKEEPETPQTEDTKQEEPEAEEPTKEPTVEDTLLSIFGGQKEPKKTDD